MSMSAADLATARVEASKPNGTIQGLLRAVGVGPYQTVLGLTAGLGVVTFTTELFVLPSIIAAAKAEWAVSQAAEAGYVCALLLSTALGGVWAGLRADSAGRRPQLLRFTAVLLACNVVAMLSPAFAMFAALRVFGCFGLGGLLPLCLSAYSEVLPRRRRGYYLATFTSLFLSGGALYGAALLASLPGHTGWRGLVAMACLPCAALLLASWKGGKESPRWLLSVGRTGAAADVLTAMAESNNVPVRSLATLQPLPGADDDDDVEAAPRSSRERRRMRLLCTLPQRRPVMLLAIVSTVLLGLLLCESLLMPALLLRMRVEMGRVAVLRAWAVLFAAGPTVHFLTTALPRNDRRRLLSAALMLTALLTCFFLRVNSESQLLAVLIVRTAAMTIALAMLCIISIESFPTFMRATGLALLQAFACLAALFTPALTAALTDSSTALPTFWLTSVTCLLLAATVACCLPGDTRGTALQDLPLSW